MKKTILYRPYARPVSPLREAGLTALLCIPVFLAGVFLTMMLCQKWLPTAKAQAAAPATMATLDHPDQLLAYTPEQLVALFAAPQLERAEGEIKVWQYRTDACVLDLYIMSNTATPAPVAYYEIRAREKAMLQPNPTAEAPQPIETKQCLEELARRANDTKTLVMARL